MDYTSAAGYVTDTQGRRQYVDRDIPNGVGGTSLVAADRNAVQNTLIDPMKTYGVPLDSADDTLLTKAIAAAVANEAARAAAVESNLQSSKAPLLAPQFSASGSDVPTTPTPDGSNPLQIANIGSVLSQIASGGGLPSQKAATGYVQLPGGLIMQFGSLNSGASGQTVIQFPIKFPGFPVGIWATEANASGGWSTGKITAHAPAAGATQTGATILSAVYGETANQWTLAGGIFFSWLAIGF